MCASGRRPETRPAPGQVGGRESWREGGWVGHVLCAGTNRRRDNKQRSPLSSSSPFHTCYSYPRSTLCRAVKRANERRPDIRGERVYPVAATSPVKQRNREHHTDPWAPCKPRPTPTAGSGQFKSYQQDIDISFYVSDAYKLGFKANIGLVRVFFEGSQGI